MTSYEVFFGLLAIAKTELDKCWKKMVYEPHKHVLLTLIAPQIYSCIHNFDNTFQRHPHTQEMGLELLHFPLKTLE